MTTQERAAVAALVAAAKKFIPPMSLPCTQDELDLQLGAQCVEQLPGFRATEQCSLEILDAACDVAAFSKMNAYPVEFSPAFFTFAQKLDRLATAINARYPGFNLNCRTSAKPETTP